MTDEQVFRMVEAENVQLRQTVSVISRELSVRSRGAEYVEARAELIATNIAIAIEMFQAGMDEFRDFKEAIITALYEKEKKDKKKAALQKKRKAARKLIAMRKRK